MKIRKGFVSNSSSSSFCILGDVFSADDFPLAKEEEFEGGWEIWETVDSYLHKSGLTYHSGISCYSEESFIIGIHAEYLDKAETIQKLCEDIEAELRDVLSLPKERKIHVHFCIDGGFQG